MFKNKGKKIITEIYDNYDEDARLVKNKKGQLEYFTTMAYIHKYLKPGMKVLEVGAGTGRYSIALAKEGYEVTAVELVKSNLAVLKKNAKGIKNITAFQGDALDLSRFKNDSFDMVLVLGPMYHLYSHEDQNQAINEALRVAKTGAALMFAFIPVHSLIYGWGMEGNNLKEAIEENFTKDFKTFLQYPEQKFTGFEITAFKKLFKDKNITPLHLIATDSVMELEEQRICFQMTDEEFELFKKYHLATCEKPELIGLSFHALYICKKK